MTQDTTTPVVVDAEEIERVSPVSRNIYNETSRHTRASIEAGVSGTCSDTVPASVPPASSVGGY